MYNKIVLDFDKLSVVLRRAGQSIMMQIIHHIHRMYSIVVFSGWLFESFVIIESNRKTVLSDDRKVEQINLIHNYGKKPVPGNSQSAWKKIDQHHKLYFQPTYLDLSMNKN